MQPQRRKGRKEPQRKLGFGFSALLCTLCDFAVQLFDFFCRWTILPTFTFFGAFMSFASAVNRKAIDIGKLSVEMTTSAGSGHPSTALSLAHLVTVLMYHQMRWDPKDPWNTASDRLVLSEGHAVPIIYAAYADLGGMVGPNKAEAKPM